MRVTSVRQQWLEDDVRRRRWMRIADAAACLREELQQFIRHLEVARRSDRESGMTALRSALAMPSRTRAAWTWSSSSRANRSTGSGRSVIACSSDSRSEARDFNGDFRLRPCRLRGSANCDMIELVRSATKTCFVAGPGVPATQPLRQGKNLSHDRFKSWAEYAFRKNGVDRDGSRRFGCDPAA